jgi:ATP-dependent protease ClpP protease subunit
MNTVQKLLSLFLTCFLLTCPLPGRAEEPVNDCDKFHPVVGRIDEKTFVHITEIHVTCVSKGVKSSISISSPGGDAHYGAASFDLLRETPGWEKLTTRAYGQVASAATMIFMAGKERLMACNSYLMIHEAVFTPSGVFDHRDLVRSTISITRINEMILGVYQKVTGLPVAQLKSMMAAETNLTVADAVRLGFATGTTTSCQ